MNALVQIWEEIPHKTICYLIRRLPQHCHTCNYVGAIQTADYHFELLQCNFGKIDYMDK